MSRPKALKKPKIKCSDNDGNDLASDVSALVPTGPPPSPSTPSCGALQVCRLRLSYVDGAHVCGGGMADVIGYYSVNDLAQLVDLTKNSFLNATKSCFAGLELTGIA